jgi:hypothetical protein
LFLLGCISDYAIHLDPHIAQPALPSRTKTGSFVPEVRFAANLLTVSSNSRFSPLQDFASYHFDGIQTTALWRLDPSLVLGFACADEQEFEECCTLISEKVGYNAPWYVYFVRAP